MGLSEAIAQGDWVRALWSEMVLGLCLREWRERKEVATSHRSRTQRAITITPQMFLRWVDRKAQVADALMAMETCYELCVAKH